MLRKSQGTKENEPQLGSAMSPSIASSQPDRTVIGEHITIEGDIRGKEDLLIEGSIKGSIDLGEYHLTVGPKGQVEAEIKADNVTISGRLMGNIHAKGKVAITKEADFTGEIKARRISVEDGAYLKAVIELERAQASPAQPMPKPVEKPVTSSGPEPLALASEGKKGS